MYSTKAQVKTIQFNLKTMVRNIQWSILDRQGRLNRSYKIDGDSIVPLPIQTIGVHVK